MYTRILCVWVMCVVVRFVRDERRSQSYNEQGVQCTLTRFGKEANLPHFSASAGGGGDIIPRLTRWVALQIKPER